MCAQYFSVDTFAPIPFHGNPAAVCIVEKSENVSDELKQQLAAEFNLTATAFPSPVDTDDFKTATKFSLRWFTPTNELDLCGNGTLAAAHVILNHLGNQSSVLEFQTKFGVLKAEQQKHGFITVTFPSVQVNTLNSRKHELTDKLTLVRSFVSVGYFQVNDPNSIGKTVVEKFIPSNIQVAQLCYSPELKYLLVALDQSTTHEQLMSLSFPHDQLVTVDPRGEHVRALIITSHGIPGSDSLSNYLALAPEPDYVVRVFEPWNGVDEDPATGSAQCVAAVFWAAVFNRTNLRSHQYHSRRGAEFRVNIPNGETIEVTGQSVTVSNGIISDRLFQ